MNMKLIATVTAIGLVGLSLAQQKTSNSDINTSVDNRVIRKIKIKHISPELLWLLLHGQTTFTTPPEPNHGGK